MNKVLKGVLEHELKNPVCAGEGIETLIGVVSLGYTPLNKKEDKAITEELHHVAGDCIVDVMYRNGWALPIKGITSKTVLEVMGSLEIMKMVNKFNGCLRWYTESPMIETFAVNTCCTRLASEFPPDFKQEEVKVFVYTWPIEDISLVELRVMSYGDMVKNTLSGNYSSR